MIDSKSNSLTEDEAALYDRQIRLWGLDAQKRLRAANVLVAGCCGLGAEVIKNLVLAGIKSITLLDHRPLTLPDTYSNFLGPHELIGENIAESCVANTQKLNPMVTVKSDTDNLEAKSDEFFKQFTVVIVCRATKDQLIRIDNICRESDVLFYFGDVYGFYGFMFADLNEHVYVEETTERKEEDVDGKKVLKEYTKTTKKVETFVPLSVALDVDWTSERYSARLRRTCSCYFRMLVLQEFEKIHSRRPQTSSKEADVVEILTIKNCLLEKMSVPENKLSNVFAEAVFAQLSPVCAVVGGVLAQEVIKAVSQNDVPHNNFFFFNSEDCSGVVENIGQ